MSAISLIVVPLLILGALTAIVQLNNPAIASAQSKLFSPWPAALQNETTPWYAGGVVIDVATYTNKLYQNATAKMVAGSDLINAYLSDKSFTFFGKTVALSTIAGVYSFLFTLVIIGILFAIRGVS